jgi:hypothetical protein
MPQLDSIGLSVRVTGRLEAAGIYSVGHLSQLGASDVLGLGLSADELEQIREELTAHGLQLVGDGPLLETKRQFEKACLFVGDCDRLEAAFAELFSTGIVCCSLEDIFEQVDAARKSGTLRGYGYYVSQAESGVDSYGLHIKYCSTVANYASIDIGTEISRTLKGHCLAAEITSACEDWLRLTLHKCRCPVRHLHYYGGYMARWAVTVHTPRS